MLHYYHFYGIKLKNEVGKNMKSLVPGCIWICRHLLNQVISQEAGVMSSCDEEVGALNPVLQLANFTSINVICIVYRFAMT